MPTALRYCSAFGVLQNLIPVLQRELVTADLTKTDPAPAADYCCSGSIDQRRAGTLEMLILCCGIKHPETSLFRTLVDSWFAFADGPPYLFLNENRKPIWFNNPDARRLSAALRRFHFISDAAELVLNTNESHDRDDLAKRLVKDHAIPLKTLREAMFKEPPSTVAAAEEFLRKNLRFGLITKDEDKKLDNARLRFRMPDGWKIGDDPFDRYRTRNAEIKGRIVRS